MIVVPIAFTTDHIETLHEIDIGFAQVAKEAGVTNFIRSESLNSDEAAIDALANVVVRHLDNQRLPSTQFKAQCAQCRQPQVCRQLL